MRTRSLGATDGINYRERPEWQDAVRDLDIPADDGDSSDE